MISIAFLELHVLKVGDEKFLKQRKDASVHDTV